jgi:hypothetical protein
MSTGLQSLRFFIIDQISKLYDEYVVILNEHSSNELARALAEYCSRHPLAGDLRKPLARTHVVSQQCDPIYGFGPLRSRIILALELFLHIVPATTVVACRAGIRIFTKRK